MCILYEQAAATERIIKNKIKPTETSEASVNIRYIQTRRPTLILKSRLGPIGRPGKSRTFLLLTAPGAGI